MRGLESVSETLDERSPRAIRILLVPHGDPLFDSELERHLLGLLVTPAFCALVGMFRISDGVDLLDGVRRDTLAKSTLNDDVIMSLLRHATEQPTVPMEAAVSRSFDCGMTSRSWWVTPPGRDDEQELPPTSYPSCTG